MAPLVELFHVPKFRSTRVLWLYYELEAIYRISRSDFPKLKLHKLSPDTFRNTFASACQPARVQITDIDANPSFRSGNESGN